MSSPNSKLRVAVVGGSGYAGGEACRLLSNHPAVGEVVPTSRGDDDFDRAHPNLLGSGLSFKHTDSVLEDPSKFHAALLCTPTGEAMRIAPALLAAGLTVVDLSADFRFDNPGSFRSAHGKEHTATQLLADAVYGATELNRHSLDSARLIANPGCYAITALLALAPLIDSPWVDTAALIHIAAVNGTTGAGITPRPETSHAEVFGSMLPYNLSGHRHAPEIEDQLSRIAGTPITVDLATAHGNYARGIFIQASVSLRADIRTDVTREDILGIYTRRYGRDGDGDFFVRINEHNAVGGLTDKDYRRYPSLASVVGSNFCHIGLDYDPRIGVVRVVGVSDNLVKGAAGSAIQNLNVALGLDETTGLRTYGL
ncbi:N-acetyl-gamma-glutamyl-phosphate reductase [Gordonia sp. ABSL11-1]|uniref:N-acetyl-gamma-glutamyl-phosphate reductase n=1 Tax=Gordonia sp. ABSL11-1 TaxID=3053924 RepID=UPI002573E0F0|nr:N-acetyl-gamma-glutamyl-phosphate reductase [Gordonia sp. ABSL11-1]MDL9947220.1 N-acetyl-gamma-glutamyl-phosphate reductase [Gordonia sp. ABSL11-1]